MTSRSEFRNGQLPPIPQWARRALRAILNKEYQGLVGWRVEQIRDDIRAILGRKRVKVSSYTRHRRSSRSTSYLRQKRRNVRCETGGGNGSD